MDINTFLSKYWEDIVFSVFVLIIVLFTVTHCYKELKPLYSVNYITPTIESESTKQLVIDISKIDGMVNTMQRTIPIYASLIVFIVVFLTWRQREAARMTAKEEVDSVIQKHEKILFKLEEDLKRKTSELTIIIESIKSSGEDVNLVVDHSKMDDVLNRTIKFLEGEDN